MGWQSVSIERQKLYDDVWSMPMAKLAASYGVSDVGLRKICISLDVPIPPRGYWLSADRAREKKKAPLHVSSVNPTYTRMLYVEDRDAEIEARFAAALSDSPINGLSDFSYANASQSGLHSQIKAVAKMAKQAKVVDGTRRIYGMAWADVNVSPGQLERTVKIIDVFANVLSLAGATFIDKHTPLQSTAERLPRSDVGPRNCFELHEIGHTLRIEERVTAEVIPSSVKKRGGLTWQPTRYKHVPTGRLVVSIHSVISSYEIHKIEDTVRGTVEEKAPKVAAQLWESTLKTRITREVHHERRVAHEKKVENWQSQKAKKDQLIRRLAGFEQMAKDLDRAESLRRLCDRIINAASAPAALLESVGDITHMADWLDPLVRRNWPGVDDVPDNNPFGAA